MLNQYIGNYLLNRGLLTQDQLCEILQDEQSAKVKLGILAVNAGLMTAAQVEEVHVLQRVKDQRFGTLAVSRGYLTDAQVGDLLATQGNGHLSLMQAIVDKGYLTLAAIEKALADFRTEYGITNQDTDEEARVVRSLVNFSAAGDEAGLLYDYVGLTLRDIVRFLNDAPYISMQSAEASPSGHYLVSQPLHGDLELRTGLRIGEAALLELAGRFYGERLTMIDELALDSAGEFWNVHNGVFCNSLSDAGLIVDLGPQFVRHGDFPDAGRSYRVGIGTSFGQLELVLSI